MTIEERDFVVKQSIALDAFWRTPILQRTPEMCKLMGVLQTYLKPYRQQCMNEINSEMVKANINPRMIPVGIDNDFKTKGQ